MEFEDPRIIVDAGAHVGLAAVVFASKYPAAEIFALEPEPANFEILQKNAALYPNIRPVQMGLWHKRARLEIADTTADTWSFRVRETDSADGIPAIDILSLMRDFELERIDVLKLDIEGSEVEVLSHSKPWLHYIDALIVELHDRFRPGCNAALNTALQDYEYFRNEYGENIVFFQLRKRVRLKMRSDYVQQADRPAVASDVFSVQTRRF